MRPLPPARRRALLAVGLALSALVGTLLGRLYEPRDEEASPPSVPPEAEEWEALAESIDLERPPSPPKSTEGTEGTDGGLDPTLARVGRPGRTGQDALRARLPVFPGSGELVSLGERLTAHGVPLQLAVFETRARPAEVLAFYARHFQARGWPYSDVRSAREAVPHPALSATLAEEGVQLTVMVMPHEEGSSVVLGQADMEAWAQGGQDEAPGDLPVYPGTRPLVVRAGTEGLADLTVSFDTPDALERVEAFYREALAQRGYALVDDAPESLGPHTLSFAGGGGRHWNLALSVVAGHTALTAHGTLSREDTP